MKLGIVISEPNFINLRFLTARHTARIYTLIRPAYECFLWAKRAFWRCLIRVSLPGSSFYIWKGIGQGQCYVTVVPSPCKGRLYAPIFPGNIRLSI